MHHFMENPQTISWIFLALAIASQNAPANCTEISNVADGINKLKPLESEIEDSLVWLEKESLVLKNGKEYWLSENGKEIFIEAKNKGLLEMWKKIQVKIEQLSK